MNRDRGQRTDDRGLRTKHRGPKTDDRKLSAEPGLSSPRLSVLLFLLIASGASALIYEVVWFELLQLVIGSSAVSLGVLLGTFMGGLCAGSLLLPRVVSSRHHPLRVYALIEIAIGSIGVLVLFV